MKELLQFYNIGITYMGYKFIFQYLFKGKKLNFITEIKNSIYISFILFMYKIIFKLLKKIKLLNHKILFFIYNFIIGFYIKKKLSHHVKLILIYQLLAKLFDLGLRKLIDKFNFNRNMAPKFIFNFCFFFLNLVGAFDQNLLTIYIIRYYYGLSKNIRNQVALRNLVGIILRKDIISLFR